MIQSREIFLGKNQAFFTKPEVGIKDVVMGGETYYKISNVDVMRPFFMSIVSNSNHWMFISSNGALSAGRKNSNFALFPYYTDDKITESEETTGSKTILLVTKQDKTFLWEPFSKRQNGIYKITRNLYKNSYGNKVIFEEINHDLSLKFSYEWNSSNQYGFIRKSNLTNVGEEQLHIRFVDGIQNILPWGVEEAVQSASSNLVDAYKKSELEIEAGIGIYALSAVIVDKAEPSEALKSNIVWSQGLEDPTYLLTSMQLDHFRRGHEVTTEVDIKAEKGAYFLSDAINLDANNSKEWMLIANVNQTVEAVVQLKADIQNNASLVEQINEDIEAGTSQLIELVGAADGLQLTADKRRNSRHFANTMFNIMRGGIFDHNYQIEKGDFLPYVKKTNKAVYQAKEALINGLPELFNLEDLTQLAEKEDDKDFKRLCLEYLPLKFSRRHGDPSRPWNKFSINTRNEIDGSKILDYQGNWRDIFQNWEALAHSYPEFIEGMIHKFLNATTFDGYNPYRVTKDGFDWETIEPDNPWSYIGYWGDHQIIYLLKFLEFIEKYYPEKLVQYFSQDLFVYANVPYRIKEYKDILKDPKNTIDFDFEGDKKIQASRKAMGIDGALIKTDEGTIYKVNFIEKILATVLAKLSNFIPEGGIWMNTQRPEWNDANNALVGNGVSMVTLYYLRRFLYFFEGVLSKSQQETVSVSEELHQFFTGINKAFDDHNHLLTESISDTDRKLVLDQLGEAGSAYRNTIYSKGFSGNKETLSKEALQSFTAIAKNFLEHSIRANERQDKLYHAYNLMTIKANDEVAISNLPEMLEGQVAVLSSGYLSTDQSLQVLDGLKASKLYREDQNSYILYPNKDLPRFLQKNNIPNQRVNQSELLQTLLNDGNGQIISKDCDGNHHFNGNFNNVNSLKEALEALPKKYTAAVEKEAAVLYQIFEEVFDHKSFTGRSGTFFGYEGLGSIYWHMVSKLLLASFEISQKAIAEGEEAQLIDSIIAHYFHINEGIGANKSPEVYGAFPTDPYSHTPGGKGAQQPGMTGQVKEDVLSRFGELGISVADGVLRFDPVLLKSEEYLTEQEDFNYVDINGQECTLAVEKGALAFTYCQVPVIYHMAEASKIMIHSKSGKVETIEGKTLDLATSRSLFKRANEIVKLVVHVKENL